MAQSHQGACPGTGTGGSTHLPSWLQPAQLKPLNLEAFAGSSPGEQLGRLRGGLGRGSMDRVPRPRWTEIDKSVSKSADFLWSMKLDPDPRPQETSLPQDDWWVGLSFFLWALLGPKPGFPRPMA